MVKLLGSRLVPANKGPGNSTSRSSSWRAEWALTCRAVALCTQVLRQPCSAEEGLGGSAATVAKAGPVPEWSGSEKWPALSSVM